MDEQIWSPDGSGGQYLTWTDTNWVLQQASAGGCVTYQWVDQPKTYTHDYALSISSFAVTGLFYDPGKPGDLWSPTNTSASQRNGDQFYDGSTSNGNPALPTYGNPAASPAIYVRVDGGFAFRVMWTGSPNDMPGNADVNLTGNPSTVVHIDTTVTFSTMSGSNVTWHDPDMAQTLGYPTWYFVGETQ